MDTTWRPYRADDYLDFRALSAWCQALAAAHPDWFSLEIAGHTRQGRPLWLVTVGDHTAGAEALGHRPAFWLDGGTHAAEWAGVMSCVYTLSAWAERLAADDEATRAWFGQHTAYVVPCISADGYQSLHEGGPYVRSSLRPAPDGTLHDGLAPRDLTGDGVVRWMRWRDPSGPLVADPDVPLYLRPRTLDDDPADAFFLAPEGRVQRWDGWRWTEAPREFGLDLNRNFPSRWQPFSMFGMDGGKYALSEPTSRAVVDAVSARPNIGAAVTNHTYTGALLTQPYRADGPLPDGDLRIMAALAEDAVAGTGYRAVRVHPDFTYDPDKPITGVWSDSLSTVLGIPGYTLELWDPYTFCGVDIGHLGRFWTEPPYPAIRAMIEVFGKEPGAQPWEAFEHPQLGSVELGGPDLMRCMFNPPPRLLEAECKRGLAVADRVRRALPQVEGTARALRVANGTAVVELDLVNRGFLSTSSLAHAETLGLVPPPVVSIELADGMALATGETEQPTDHLDGWGTSRVGGSKHPLFPGLGTRGDRTRQRWVVRGAGPVTVRWTSARAGRGSIELTLPDCAEESGGE